MNAQQLRRIDIAKKRLAKLKKTSSTPPPKYLRAHFGLGWTDSDSDGQDERAEVLVMWHRPGPKKVPLVYADESERRVVSGRWRCKFAGEFVTEANQLDIDHLVPLSEAWASGAHEWKPEKRVRYANGHGIKRVRRSWLWPVTAGLNRSKGARRPDEWLPPNEKVHWRYAADWIWTKLAWGLTVTEAERAKLLELLTVND